MMLKIKYELEQCATCIILSRIRNTLVAQRFKMGICTVFCLEMSIARMLRVIFAHKTLHMVVRLATGAEPVVGNGGWGYPPRGLDHPGCQKVGRWKIFRAFKNVFAT